MAVERRMNIAERHAFALDLIRDAGALAQGYFRDRDALTITAKGLQDMASQADVETELLIRGRLAAAFPQDAFLGEETGATAVTPGQGIWVVDPIDGTQPFISGLSAWCVSIAFVTGREVQFGMVYAPERDELFAGGVGIPATLNGKPISGHRSKSLAEGIVAVGFSPRLGSNTFIPLFAAILAAGGVFYREGSGALALCYVAAGRLNGFIEQHINSWDCLGALAVLRAAGLETSDFLSGDGLTKGGHLIAGNADVYAQLHGIYQKQP